MGALESTEGEKSPTWVECLIRKKFNIEILMTIYGLMGSYWLVLMGLQEKIKDLIFLSLFWLEIF
jgi:hypothetical protein